jgi:hypothetical protein
MHSAIIPAPPPPLSLIPDYLSCTPSALRPDHSPPLLTLKSAPIIPGIVGFALFVRPQFSFLMINYVVTGLGAAYFVGLISKFSRLGQPNANSKNLEVHWFINANIKIIPLLNKAVFYRIEACRETSSTDISSCRAPTIAGMPATTELQQQE